MLPFAFCPACYSAALTSDGFLFLDSLGGYKGGILGPLLFVWNIWNSEFHPPEDGLKLVSGDKGKYIAIAALFAFALKAVAFPIETLKDSGQCAVVEVLLETERFRPLQKLWGFAIWSSSFFEPWVIPGLGHTYIRHKDSLKSQNKGQHPRGTNIFIYLECSSTHCSGA